MIVAPLMTPILGMALALVLADRPHLLRSLVHVLLGARGRGRHRLRGRAAGRPVRRRSSATRQVSGRISPKLIDLLAALATGTVGAFALVRSDISDALPGVAIAISLVPPLAVTGLLLEVGRMADAAESALLFATNVAAIIATGTLVLVPRAAPARRRGRPATRSAAPAGGRTRWSPGCCSSWRSRWPRARCASRWTSCSRRTPARSPRSWAREAGWEITTVDALNGVVTVNALGPPPSVDPETLRAAFDRGGLEDVDLRLRLVVGGTRLCPADEQECTAPVPGT